jgi:hypothetical protein
MKSDSDVQRSVQDDALVAAKEGAAAVISAGGRT